MIKVQFTATVFNPDTEETFNGWVDPQWNRFELRSEPTDVKVYEFETRAEAEEFVESTIGVAGASGYDGVTWTAEDSVFEPMTGEDWSYAAHFSVDGRQPVREAGTFTSYRGKMLANVGVIGDTYRMKVTGDDGETKWFNITSTELEKIIEVLEPEDYAAATEALKK